MRVEEARADYLDAVASQQEWPVMTIEDVVDVNPRIDKSSIPGDLSVSFVPMPAVGAGDGSINVEETRLAREVKKGFTAFLEGDVLFAKITPCMENGKMAVVPKLVNGFGFGSTEFHVLRPKPGINARYLYYYVSSQTFRGEAERHMTGAVGQRRVPTAYLKECKIPVAPIDQQKRIVAEIEKQFSRLDEAVANLKRVKANLKRYKAAVLKAAVEGKLTEEWRKAHPDVEPANKLLGCILAKRRAKWEEAELAKMEAKGKAPKNDKWKAKYKAPTAPGITDRPDLPEGWVWATIEQLTWLVTSGSRGWGDYYSDEGVLFIRAQDIKTDALHVSGVVRVAIPPGVEGTRSSVSFRDILITITGANVTKSALVQRLDELAYVSQHVALLKLCLPETAPFIFNWIISPGNGRKTLESWAYGAGKPGLSLEQVRSLPVAIPPLSEQHRIAAEVDRLLSLTRETENQVGTNLQRVERLRQSVLRNVFSRTCSHRARIHIDARCGDERIDA